MQRGRSRRVPGLQPCRRCRGRVWRLEGGWLPALLAVLAITAANFSHADESRRLKLDGMTFVATRGERTELIVRAAHARIDPVAELADLEQVQVHFAQADGRTSLELSCDRGRFDLESNDLLAEGNVRGRTGDGRRFASPWIRYDAAKELAYTDADVEILEGPTTFRGSGFRYHASDGRLRLLDATLVQTP